MATDEIVQAFVNGALGDTATVWKSGMANWASIAEVPELMTAIEQATRRTRPTASGKIIRPSRPASAPISTTKDSAADTASQDAPANLDHAAQASKPPAPKRVTATGASVRSSIVEQGPVVAAPMKVENMGDALDPAASAGDFYAKLLAKVGTSKSKSTPPTSVAESKPVQRATSTVPPPRQAVASSRIPPSRIIASVGKEPTATDASSNLDSTAPPADFYAKILAKVRPQKTESVPPANAEMKLPGTWRTTLTPPTWGAISSHPESHAQEQLPPQFSAPTLPGTGAPIRAFDSTPARALHSVAGATGAADALEKSVNTERAFGETADERQGQPDSFQGAEPLVTRRPSPSPPKRPEPVIPVDIQLPPMNSSGEAVLPGGLGVVVSGSTRPPAPEPTPIAAPETNPATADKPSTEIVADISAPGFRENRTGRRRRVSGTATAVGLVLVCGAAAAAVYALKISPKNITRAGTEASAAAPIQTSSNNTEASALPAPAALAPSAAGLVDADQVAQAAPGSGTTQTVRSLAGKRGVDTPHNVSNTLTAAAAVGKSPAAAPVPPASNNPSFQQAVGDATNTKPAIPTTLKSASAPGGLPFNREAAMAVLGVAASQVASCKRPDGPVGNGKVLVTFDASGRVVIANVVGEGFAGTPVARCVAGLFQRVRVAPFSGDRSTVSKAFTIMP
jgi:hypothetical protein